MARRILPPKLERVGKGLFMRSHKASQLLFKPRSVSFYRPSCVPADQKQRRPWSQRNLP